MNPNIKKRDKANGHNWNGRPKVKGMVAFMKGQKNNKQQAKTLKKVLQYIENYKIFLALSLAFAVATVVSTLYEIGRAHV